ncbi:NAD(P)H-binding protein [Parasediminibacterium sp. JCM 36343]|uniref:NmrA family NAD(P)-binding protein n=1 Tax=Parasediminibacterium sp. JCM 36343 TaxID=3374279 RepID=UPI00397E5259
MNYVITGSLGNISKPIVAALVAAGHSVKVITSSADRVAAIEDLGATALVGSVEEASFVNSSFAGADAVYLMVPPKWAVANWLAYQQQISDNYVAAIAANNIKYVVQLSSIGAHLRKGAGPIDGLGYLEEKLAPLTDVNLLMLRPSYFMNNLYGMIGLVKQANIFGANFGGKEPLVLVDPSDIAAVASEALLHFAFKGHSIQYIASDERTTDEIAAILGEAIGKPGTPWVVFTDEQSLQGMLGAGLDEEIANGYTQMGKSIREGLIQEDYFKHKPVLGKIKLEDFAKGFAAAYNA